MFSWFVKAPDILLGSFDAHAASIWEVAVIFELKLSWVGTPKLSWAGEEYGLVVKVLAGKIVCWTPEESVQESLT